LKTAVIEQLELTGSVEAQLLLSVNGAPMMIEEMFTGATFEFVRVRVCGELLEPTTCPGKTKDVADNEATGLRIANCNCAEWTSVEPDTPVTVTGKTPPGVPAWLVLMVMVDVATFDPGTTFAGEKLHVELFGSPAQDNETEFAKFPPSGLM